MHPTRRTILAGTAASAAVLGMPLPPPARAAAPMAGKQAPGFYRFKVGDHEVTVLNDGIAPFPLQAIRAGADEVNAALEAAYLPKGQLTAPFNVTLVNTGSKLVLIDTGNGSTRPTAGLLTQNLAAAGYDPKSIDTVVISHFHGDHISGLLNAQNAPVYPNAEILVPAGEWAFWMDDGQMSRAPEAMKGVFTNARRVFGALGNKVTQYEGGKEVAPGITSMATPGHTPGHISYVVTSGTGRLFVQSDVTAVVALLIVHRPEWAIGGDVDGAMASDTRRKVYDMLAAERMPLTGYHLPFPATGYIEKGSSGYRFVPSTWSPTI